MMLSHNLERIGDLANNIAGTIISANKAATEISAMKP